MRECCMHAYTYVTPPLFIQLLTVPLLAKSFECIYFVHKNNFVWVGMVLRECCMHAYTYVTPPLFIQL